MVLCFLPDGNLSQNPAVTYPHLNMKRWVPKSRQSNHCPFPTIPEECADGWSFHFINGAKGLLTEHNNTGTTKLSLLALITPSELLNHLAPAHPQSVYWVNSGLYWMDGRGCSTRGSISIEEHEPILLTISLFQFFPFEFFFDTGYSPSSHH